MELVVNQKVREVFKPRCSAAITADCWTDAARRPYLGVTGHYIDNNWNLCNCTFGLMYLPGSHSGTKLARAMGAIVDKYAGKHLYISGTVVDGDGAAQNSATEFASSENALWCFAHRAALCVKDALSCHRSAIESLRQYIATVRNTIEFGLALNRKQEKLGMNVKSLKLDNDTRWSSTYEMFNRYV
jgi:zinc finger BED domain-containing protein 1 (E3 SUMO-protein ligase ZBED1)